MKHMVNHSTLIKRSGFSGGALNMPHSAVSLWLIPRVQKQLIFLKNFIIFHFYTISKGYFPFTLITKYWLYFSCCTIHP